MPVSSRRPSRSLAPVLVAGLLLAGCSADGAEDPTPVAPSADPSGAESGPTDSPAAEGFDSLEDVYAQQLDWAGCPADVAGDSFDCAQLTVPVDYDEPTGETLTVQVLRAPATAGPAQGSLVVNPGGPGGSGVDYATSGSSLASEDVLGVYDVVGFDPRGVGRSTPIDCLDDAALDDYMALDVVPEDDADVAALEGAVDDFVTGCEERSGDLLAHVGTVDVARDLDVLRAALGDDQLTYLGKSYGTFIGAVYAELFPENVGRLVLDGAIDPALEGGEVGLGQTAGFELALSTFIDWCLIQTSCALGSEEGEARDMLAALLADAADTPLPTADPERPLTQSLMIFGIILPLYLPSDQGYPLLETALGAAVEGDGSVLAQFADLYLGRNADGTFEGNQNEAIVAVNCLDRPEDVTVADIEAELPAYVDASPIFGEFLGWSGLTCTAWPYEPEAPPAEIAAEGADPILVVGTTGDPATPYEWAESLADQLSSGVLLTYEGDVHTAYRAGSECVDDAVDGYLIDGTVPEDGLRCS